MRKHIFFKAMPIREYMLALSIVFSLSGCMSKAPKSDGKAKEGRTDGNIVATNTANDTISMLYSLYLTEAEFIYLDSLTKGSNKIGFQFFLSQANPNTLNMLAWSGGGNQKYDPHSVPLHISGAYKDVAGKDIILGTQKLIKQHIKSITDRLKSNTNNNEIVVFYPEFRGDNQIQYRVEILSDTSSIRKLNAPPLPPPPPPAPPVINTNPSPPASHSDDEAL